MGMLNVYYGNMQEAIFNTSVYFKNVYEDEWITDPVAKEMILDVDKSIVLDGAVIDSPVMGKDFTHRPFRWCENADSYEE